MSASELQQIRAALKEAGIPVYPQRILADPAPGARATKPPAARRHQKTQSRDV